MTLRDVGQALWHTVATGPDPAPTLLPRRFARWRPYARPAVVGIAFLLSLSALANVRGYGAWGEVVGLLGVAPLAVLAYRPLMAWRLAIVVAFVGLSTPALGEEAWPWQPTQVLVFLAVLFVVGTSQRVAVYFWVWAISAAVAWTFVSVENRVGVVVGLTVIAVVSDQIRRRTQAQHRLAAEEERGAVFAERARIARELHDVVAHHMSLIAVRSETAPYRLGELTEPVRGEFTEVSRSAREALTEMRRLLGVLRSQEDAAATTPQPGLADLPALVAAAREAGASVRLDVPDADDVPAAVGLSAYRIVQEALTNAARHAPGAPISVTLAVSGEDLTVTVHNGASGRAPVGGGSGHGVLGMRERAAMLGGSLAAGPTGDGGYEVRARLPLTGSTA